MDDSRFDCVTRTLAARHGRRTAIRGLAAAALALASAVSGRAGVGATCGKTGTPCNDDRGCCTGFKCLDGVCKCPTGTTLCNGNCVSLSSGYRTCNGICVDTKSDERNCGQCGRVCPKGYYCNYGTCCPAGTTCILPPS